MPMPQHIRILSTIDPMIPIATLPLAILPAAVSHLCTNSEKAQHKGPQRYRMSKSVVWGIFGKVYEGCWKRSAVGESYHEAYACRADVVGSEVVRQPSLWKRKKVSTAN